MPGSASFGNLTCETDVIPNGKFPSPTLPQKKKRMWRVNENDDVLCDPATWSLKDSPTNITKGKKKKTSKKHPAFFLHLVVKTPNSVTVYTSK